MSGWTPFVALQTEYNLVERTPEKDLLPMAREFDIAIMPWSPLASGLLTGKHSKNQQTEVDSGRAMMVAYKQSDRNTTISQAVEKVAQEIGKSPAQVALNWLLQKPGTLIPIIGARTIGQLEDNLGCLDFILTPEQMAYLDLVSQIDLGFPHTFISSDMVKNLISGGTTIRTK
nr:aldo/keto reductase [Aliterella atlantica]